MPKKEARALTRWRLRGGLERYHARLAEIGKRAEEQRRKCGEEYQQTKAELEAAVERERRALEEARADKAKAEAARKAAADRLAAARAEKRAKTKHDRDTCKIEKDKLAEERRALRDKQREDEAVERALLAVQPGREVRQQTASEEREQVDREVPEEYRPLWEEVRRTFKVPERGRGYKSLAEAFLQYAAENPDAVAAAQERAAERAVAEMEREQRRRGRGASGSRRSSGGGRRSADPAETGETADAPALREAARAVDERYLLVPEARDLRGVVRGALRALARGAGAVLAQAPVVAEDADDLAASLAAPLTLRVALGRARLHVRGSPPPRGFAARAAWRPTLGRLARSFLKARSPRPPPRRKATSAR
jgi:hypothetical protein